MRTFDVLCSYPWARDDFTHSVWTFTWCKTAFCKYSTAYALRMLWTNGTHLPLGAKKKCVHILKFRNFLNFTFKLKYLNENKHCDLNILKEISEHLCPMILTFKKRFHSSKHAYHQHHIFYHSPKHWNFLGMKCVCPLFNKASKMKGNEIKYKRTLY